MLVIEVRLSLLRVD